MKVSPLAATCPLCKGALQQRSALVVNVGISAAIEANDGEWEGEE